MELHRLSSIFVTLLGVTLLTSFATSIASADETADFQITAPKTWKLDSDGGFQVYRLQASKTQQTVTIEKLDIAGKQSSFDFLAGKRIKLEAERAKFMAQFGLVGYRIHDVSEDKTKNGRKFQVIQSSFINNSGRDVQLYERQYPVGDVVYRVTYSETSHSLNDLKRIKITLDNFQPKFPSSSRMPAASTGEAVPGAQTEAAKPETVSQGLSVMYDKLSTPASPEYCNDPNILEKDKMTPNSAKLEQELKNLSGFEFFKTQYLGLSPASRERHAKASLLPEGVSAAQDNISEALVGCAKTFVDGIIAMIGIGVKAYQDEQFRDQIKAMASNVYSSLKSDFSGTIGRGIVNVTAALSKITPKFMCYNWAKRLEFICTGGLGAVMIGNLAITGVRTSAAVLAPAGKKLLGWMGKGARDVAGADAAIGAATKASEAGAAAKAGEAVQGAGQSVGQGSGAGAATASAPPPTARGDVMGRIHNFRRRNRGGNSSTTPETVARESAAAQGVKELADLERGFYMKISDNAKSPNYGIKKLYEEAKIKSPEQSGELLKKFMANEADANSFRTGLNEILNPKPKFDMAAADQYMSFKQSNSLNDLWKKIKDTDEGKQIFANLRSGGSVKQFEGESRRLIARLERSGELPRTAAAPESLNPASKPGAAPSANLNTPEIVSKGTREAYRIESEFKAQAPKDLQEAYRRIQSDEAPELAKAWLNKEITNDQFKTLAARIDRPPFDAAMATTRIRTGEFSPRVKAEWERISKINPEKAEELYGKLTGRGKLESRQQKFLNAAKEVQPAPEAPAIAANTRVVSDNLPRLNEKPPAAGAANENIPSAVLNDNARPGVGSSRTGLRSAEPEAAPLGENAPVSGTVSGSAPPANANLAGGTQPIRYSSAVESARNMLIRDSRPLVEGAKRLANGSTTRATTQASLEELWTRAPEKANSLAAKYLRNPKSYDDFANNVNSELNAIKAADAQAAKTAALVEKGEHFVAPREPGIPDHLPGISEARTRLDKLSPVAKKNFDTALKDLKIQEGAAVNEATAAKINQAYAKAVNASYENVKDGILGDFGSLTHDGRDLAKLLSGDGKIISHHQIEDLMRHRPGEFMKVMEKSANSPLPEIQQSLKTATLDAGGNRQLLKGVKIDEQVRTHLAEIQRNDPELYRKLMRDISHSPENADNFILDAHATRYPTSWKLDSPRKLLEMEPDLAHTGPLSQRSLDNLRRLLADGEIISKHEVNYLLRFEKDKVAQAIRTSESPKQLREKLADLSSDWQNTRAREVINRIELSANKDLADEVGLLQADAPGHLQHAIKQLLEQNPKGFTPEQLRAAVAQARRGEAVRPTVKNASPNEPIVNPKAIEESRAAVAKINAETRLPDNVQTALQTHADEAAMLYRLDPAGYRDFLRDSLSKLKGNKLDDIKLDVGIEMNRQFQRTLAQTSTEELFSGQALTPKGEAVVRFLEPNPAKQQAVRDLLRFREESFREALDHHYGLEFSRGNIEGAANGWMTHPGANIMRTRLEQRSPKGLKRDLQRMREVSPGQEYETLRNLADEDRLYRLSQKASGLKEEGIPFDVARKYIHDEMRLNSIDRPRPPASEAAAEAASDAAENTLKVREMAAQIRERAAAAADDLKPRVQEIVSNTGARVGSKVSETVESVSESAARAGNHMAVSAKEIGGKIRDWWRGSPYTKVPEKPYSFGEYQAASKQITKRFSRETADSLDKLATIDFDKARSLVRSFNKNKWTEQELQRQIKHSLERINPSAAEIDAEVAKFNTTRQMLNSRPIKWPAKYRALDPVNEERLVRQVAEGKMSVRAAGREMDRLAEEQATRWQRLRTNTIRRGAKASVFFESDQALDELKKDALIETPDQPDEPQLTGNSKLAQVFRETPRDQRDAMLHAALPKSKRISDMREAVRLLEQQDHNRYAHVKANLDSVAGKKATFYSRPKDGHKLKPSERAKYAYSVRVETVLLQKIKKGKAEQVLHFLNDPPAEFRNFSKLTPQQKRDFIRWMQKNIK